MGFPMFCNLAGKIPSTSTVHFYDVNPESMERALREPGLVAKLDRCSSAKEVAEKSVSFLFFERPPPTKQKHDGGRMVQTRPKLSCGGLHFGSKNKSE